ncbi:MAG: hypothetical protein U1E83_01800 [Methylotetracoccus sp.]
MSDGWFTVQYPVRLRAGSSGIVYLRAVRRCVFRGDWATDCCAAQAAVAEVLQPGTGIATTWGNWTARSARLAEIRTARPLLITRCLELVLSYRRVRWPSWAYLRDVLAYATGGGYTPSDFPLSD